MSRYFGEVVPPTPPPEEEQGSGTRSGIPEGYTYSWMDTAREALTGGVTGAPLGPKMPTWVIPAVIVAGVIGLVVVSGGVSRLGGYRRRRKSRRSRR